ncbi:MAG TPA: hypothetical protein VFI47_13450 [Acidimicrobiales bacterium]|nr:hypothetical protein [Acidimicrobiales bacterium]
MARVDFEDDRTLFDDLVALHTADDAGELHRRLLCFGSGGGNKTDAFEPWCLFHNVHAEEPEGAVVTALLLLTDGRWRNTTGRLVRQIEESGLVPDDQLDLLAQTFLAAGPQVFWEAPGDWFTGPAIVLDPDVPGAVEVIEDDEPGGPGDGPVAFAREVRPPLRRWAAARAVRSDPSCWGAVVQQARQVDPRGGAAIIHGLVDSIGLLTPAARDFVLDLAENWPQRRVREAATALRHAPPGPAPAAGSAEGSVASPAPGAPAPSTVQPSLF